MFVELIAFFCIQNSVNERKKIEAVAVAPIEIDQDQIIVSEILEELIEKICYGEKRKFSTLTGDIDCLFSVSFR